jgi:hypothetical protein
MARADKTRRGSPEAIAKRRAARALNRIFDRGVTTTTLDGRTIKRKSRLLEELKEGRRGEPLKAHEVLSHVTELLTLGENLTSIRRLKPRLPPAPPLEDPAVVKVVQDTQRNYQFDSRAWKLLGVDIDAVMAGKPAAAPKPARKRAAKKTARKKKA